MKSLLEQCFNTIIHSNQPTPRLEPSTRQEILAHFHAAGTKTHLINDAQIGALLHILVERRVIAKFIVGNGIELFASHDCTCADAWVLSSSFFLPT